MMRNAEDLTVKTLNVREVGSYEGQGIAGTSDDVVSAVLTKEYRFADGITIRVVDVPVRLDRTTGKTYLSGADGRELMALVRHYLALLRAKRAQQTRSLIRIPVNFTLPARAQIAA